MPEQKTEQKGIVFLQTPQGKLCLIEETTFTNYLQSLPKNERGWREFRFDDYKKLSRRGLFANITPIKKAV